MAIVFSLARNQFEKAPSDKRGILVRVLELETLSIAPMSVKRTPRMTAKEWVKARCRVTLGPLVVF
jgi:hypothetical protein